MFSSVAGWHKQDIESTVFDREVKEVAEEVTNVIDSFAFISSGSGGEREMHDPSRCGSMTRGLLLRRGGGPRQWHVSEEENEIERTCGPHISDV